MGGRARDDVAKSRWQCFEWFVLVLREGAAASFWCQELNRTTDDAWPTSLEAAARGRRYSLLQALISYAGDDDLEHLQPCVPPRRFAGGKLGLLGVPMVLFFGQGCAGSQS